MVSARDSGSSGPGSGPGQGHGVVFLGNSLYSHDASLHHPGVSMGTGVMLGVTLRWTSIPSRAGSINTPSRFMLRKPKISAGLMGLPRLVTETLPCLQKFGFINGVDNVNWPPYRDSKS